MEPHIHQDQTDMLIRQMCVVCHYAVLTGHVPHTHIRT